MSSHYIVFQKYFEPIFILLIFILFKNFLSENILNFKKNTFIFVCVIFTYFLFAVANIIFNISINLPYSI